MTMNVRALLNDASLPDIEISQLVLDSREITPGDAFIAIPGTQQDGRQFISTAFTQGAVAVLCEADDQSTLTDSRVIMLPALRSKMGELADRFYGSPSQAQTVIAVTGTNGKTSVVDLAAQMLRQTRGAAGSIGTLGARLDQQPQSATNTTPDCLALHRQLSQWRAENVRYVTLEASSHALDQGRLDGLSIDVGVFTNLSRDHLDYHGTMDAYRAAKLRLFEALLPRGRTAVLNADSDAYSAFAAASIMAGLGVMGVGERGRDLTLIGRQATPEGQRLTLDVQGEVRDILLPLAGAFQASNALVAAGLCIAAGDRPDAVIGALEGLTGAQGRLQRIGAETGRGEVYVDYAHTPDGLETVLTALRPHATGRLIVVFGAGGDRDRGKRPLMGEIAARLADVAIVTDDNPRSEDPASIRAQVRTGCPDALEIGDRRAAIEAAIEMMRDGDVVVIAGKGHEQGQIVGGTTHPFDDATVASEALSLYA